MVIHVLPPESYLRFQRNLSRISGGMEYTHVAIMRHPAAGTIQVYVKIYPDGYGVAKGLANEVTGFLLASALELPQPALGFLALIPAAVLHQPPAWLKRNRGFYPAWCTQRVEAGHPPGMIFNFKDKVATKLFKRDLSKWPCLPKTLAYDEWISNVDRHFNNLLRLGQSNYCLIDHGRLIADDGNWSVQDLGALQFYRNRLMEHLWQYQPPLNVKSAMMHFSGSHQNTFKAVAAEMKFWAETLLSGDDATAICAFLQERARSGPDLVRKRYGLVL